MFAVIYLPDFFLQAQCRDSYKAAPMALVETDVLSGEKKDSKARIVALNEAARESHIHVGMTAAQGQARYGKLTVLTRSKEIEQATSELLLRLANEFTPYFELSGPGICTLDLMRARCTDHGWELGWQIVEELAAAHSLRAQVGFAKTPDLALMIAKQADPVRSVTGDGEDEFLRQLPVIALNPPVDMAMVLNLWGIETVGDFFALPGDDVADRLGAEAFDLWERVTGRKSRLLHLVRSPKEFSQMLDFDDEIHAVEPLLFSLRRVLEALCFSLREAWQTAGEIHLQLFFPKNAAEYEHHFRVPDPTTDVELLFRILHAHLENFVTKAPVIGLRLKIIPARSTKRQSRLFESSLVDSNRFAETLARLEALLGSENVGIPECLDSHRPDSFRMMPFRENNVEPVEIKPPQKVALGLPLCRFRPPVFAEVTLCPKNQHPFKIRSAVVEGIIKELRGPWSVSGDWWRGTGAGNHEARWSRVEWDVEISHPKSGGLYRLVCEEKSEWKLEGVYA